MMRSSVQFSRATATSAVSFSFAGNSEILYVKAMPKNISGCLKQGAVLISEYLVYADI
jgi:hypothetical protein